jgi:hypothetical protein
MNEAAILERAVKAMELLGLKVLTRRHPRGAGQRRADAWLRVAKDKAQIDFVAEVKPAVTLATLGAVVAQLRHADGGGGRAPLLVADYLAPPVAEKLLALEQQFVDAAGNAYLEGPGLFVYVTGRKPAGKQTAPRANAAFTVGGLKVVFALICDPPLADAPHRAIAAAAGVALGTVPAVLGDLRQTAQLLVAGKRRRLVATRQLLDEWALAYTRRLRPKTLLAKYVPKDFAAWHEWQLDATQARWGGEPAANLLVGYLKPGVLTIYANKLPPRLMIEHRLVFAGRMDNAGCLELRKPFWGKALRLGERPHTVPPALVYADLLATGDGRCIETAQMVYDRYLARLFPAA